VSLCSAAPTLLTAFTLSSRGGSSNSLRHVCATRSGSKVVSQRSVQDQQLHQLTTWQKCHLDLCVDFVTSQRMNNWFLGILHWSREREPDCCHGPHMLAHVVEHRRRAQKLLVLFKNVSLFFLRKTRIENYEEWDMLLFDCFKYLLITEFGLDAMLCSTLRDANCDAGPIKCSRGPQVLCPAWLKQQRKRMSLVSWKFSIHHLLEAFVSVVFMQPYFATDLQWEDVSDTKLQWETNFVSNQKIRFSLVGRNEHFDVEKLSVVKQVRLYCRRSNVCMWFPFMRIFLPLLLRTQHCSDVLSAWFLNGLHNWNYNKRKQMPMSLIICCIVHLTTTVPSYISPPFQARKHNWCLGRSTLRITVWVSPVATSKPRKLTMFAKREGRLQQIAFRSMRFSQYIEIRHLRDSGFFGSSNCSRSHNGDNLHHVC